MCVNRIHFASFSIIRECAGKVEREERAFPLHSITEIKKINDKTFIFVKGVMFGLEVEEDYYELVIRLNAFNN